MIEPRRNVVVYLQHFSTYHFGVIKPLRRFACYVDVRRYGFHHRHQEQHCNSSTNYRFGNGLSLSLSAIELTRSPLKNQMYITIVDSSLLAVRLFDTLIQFM